MANTESALRSQVAPDNDDHVKNIQNPAANEYCPDNNPILDGLGGKWWINYHWSQETGAYAARPFDSIFDPKTIENVADGVKLQILPPGPNQDRWRTSELVLTGEHGEIKADYGKHLLTIRADEPDSLAKLDPNAVFGFFFYQYSPAPSSEGPNKYREIDFIELLGGNGKSQFMLQPYNWKGGNNLSGHLFTLPDCKVITIVGIWDIDSGSPNPDPYCHFYCFIGDYSFENLPSWESAYATWRSNPAGFGKLVPHKTPTSCARLHINLWLMNGQAPSKPQSVVVTRYQYAR